MRTLAKPWKSAFRLPKLHGRQRALLSAGSALAFLLFIWLGSVFLPEGGLQSQLELRNVPPSPEHLFGTDWLGRDMLTRTWKGLQLSLQVGFIAGGISVILATVLGLSAAVFGKGVDRVITWLIDLFLSVPHLVALILIAFVLGGGAKGVIAGVALTHWPALTRVIRAEVLRLRSSEYVLISKRMGKSAYWIGSRHLLPHLLPQLLTGLVLVIPHAILHEAAVTFVGLGLSPHEPAIGVILSESMRYLSAGLWWLAVFPGLCLFLVVRSIAQLGEQCRLLTDPHHSHD
ncbi:ABC transporter permease [Paenibacillus sp. GD4]|jgi:peptide/nickel transport system permease protein|uniref:ABC transporter permease n=1 Tax=Paenibacillus sp. GD4 TaxID=3068890 RepID=UPI00279677F8|nr:ABC transporter permease [Paenibacillus sp. GD4]MDQ1909965.1 ABC transporter permease [Paenibacillus sp. GD4]